MARKEKGNSREGRMALVILAALGARLVCLLRRPPWFDEIFTLWISRKPVRELIAALRTDSGPPLFYLLEKPFVRLAELSHRDEAARLLPFLALAMLFALGSRRRFSAGRGFPLLLATCPLLFFYSGEARTYALLALASFGLFLAVFRSRTGGRSLGFAAALSAVLPMLHYLGGLVLAGSAVLSAARRQWRMLAAQVLGGSVFLLWLPAALAQPPQALAWTAEAPAGAALGFLEKIGFWGSYPPYFTAARAPLPWAGAALGLLLLAGAAVVARTDPRVLEALAFALLPILFAALAGFRRPIFFPGRTEMATFPVLLWAAARAGRRSEPVRLLCALTAAAGAAVILLALAFPPSPAPYAVTARFVAARARAGDLTITAGADYLPLLLARDRGELAGGLLGVPAGVESHPGWFEPGRIGQPDREASRLAAAAAGVRRGGAVRVAFPPDPALLALARNAFAGRRGSVRLPPGGDSVLELREP